MNKIDTAIVAWSTGVSAWSQTIVPAFHCPRCEADGERDFEAWEAYVDLYERDDFPGLVRLYEADLRRWPDDVNTHCELGDAYVRNGQPQRAIDLLTPLHRADPGQTAYHHAILDALVRPRPHGEGLRLAHSAPRVSRGPGPA